MPVMIAAFQADLDIVRAVAAGLRESGGEVRCYLEEDDHELRQLGCKIAVGELDDEDRMEAALTNVHTFMLLLPDILTIAENPESAKALGRAATAAAARSDIEQTILGVSGCRPGASELSEMLDEIESLLTAEVDPLCVIRTGVVVGEDRLASSLPWPRRAARAVDIDTLAEVLVAADDREGTSGVWELGGTPHPAPSDVQSRATARSANTDRLTAWLEAALASAPPTNSAADKFGIPVAASQQ